ncbi:pleiotropic regulatory protein RsmS [Aeromonas sp. sia0103]|nr:pleiotropic regulatory protein RsmS [Aeromonas sp. sia0103]
MSLENAPPEVKLAVDLIELLETNQIDPALALAALAIVQRDYEHKVQRDYQLKVQRDHEQKAQQGTEQKNQQDEQDKQAG